MYIDPKGASPRGVVALVGAGPGAADLLTVRALHRLREADAVVHDWLVSEEVLALARPDAERIFVGKARANHCLPQADINALLIRLARAGKRVVRLKGGDPLVFGRGGEEAEALAAAGVRYEIVPGVTAALACAADAGIPLTHREASRSVTLATGHTKGLVVRAPAWSANGPTLLLIGEVVARGASPGAQAVADWRQYAAVERTGGAADGARAAGTPSPCRNDWPE